MSDETRWHTTRRIAESRRYGGDVQMTGKRMCELFDTLDDAAQTLRLAAEWIAEPEPKNERPGVVVAMCESMVRNLRDFGGQR